MDLSIDIRDKDNFMCISNRTTGIIICPSPTRNSILFKTNDVNAMCITDEQCLNLNTSSQLGRINIGCSGTHISMINTSNENAIGSLLTDENGNMHFTSSGNICLNNDVVLKGTMIDATASELNYLSGVTVGVASANKAIVLDYNSSISDIDTISASTIISSNAIDTISGGTGIKSYQNGDLLVGNINSRLTKLQKSNKSDSLLITTSNGITWAYSYIPMYFTILASFNMINISTYEIGPFYARSKTSQTIYSVPKTTIDFLTTNLNRDKLTMSGLLYAPSNSTTITGINTNFTTTIAPGTIITIGSESKKVLSITNNTTLTVDSSFIVLNQWVLGTGASLINTAGTPKFGVGTFLGNGSTTARLTLICGIPFSNYITNNTKPWTIEFWVKFRIVNVAQRVLTSNSANALQLGLTSAARLTLSLGNGTSFSIANALTASLITLSNARYYHIALSYDGSKYQLWLDGTSQLSITSSIALPISTHNAMSFAANVSGFDGNIDEIRISKIARYTTNTFAVQTSQFALDANCISLNHLDNIASPTLSDDMANSNQWTNMPFFIDGNIYPNTVYYGYALTADPNSIDGVSIEPENGDFAFSSNSIAPPIPLAYSMSTRIPAYVITNASNTFIPIVSNDSRSYFGFMTPITIVSALSNVSPTFTTTDLNQYIPSNACSVELIVNHTRTTSSGSCTVIIGYNSLGYTNSLLPLSLVMTAQMSYRMNLINTRIDTALSVSSSTYTIQIVGFYI